MNNVYDLFNLIGKNLKRIRQDVIGISQEKLAEENNLSRSFISHIESQNVDCGVSLDTLFYLSQKYEFDLRIFFDGYENLMTKKDNDN